MEIKCDSCNGKGKIIAFLEKEEYDEVRTCPVCGGFGKVERTETERVQGA